jgi:hypothetical protein
MAAYQNLPTGHPMTIASMIRAFFGVYGKVDDTGQQSKWFPIKAAIALLALYAAMHLTVGAILHFMSSDSALMDVHAEPAAYATE